MDHKTINNILEKINKILEEEQIPLGAIQLMGYIVEHKNITTNVLIKLTSYSSSALHRNIQLLAHYQYIDIDKSFRPFSYTITAKGEQFWAELWEGA